MQSGYYELRGILFSAEPVPPLVPWDDPDSAALALLAPVVVPCFGLGLWLLWWFDAAMRLPFMSH